MDIALKSSVWVTSPEFAGWLMKRGFHWRKLWKKRWVALHGAEIVYMDKEPTLENSSTMVMTKAKITSATTIEPDDIDGNELGFKVNINDGKSPMWCLRAESDLEKKNWLTRLNHVIAIVRWLEEYEKVRVLGVGGTGVVYELLHKANGQKYAMKEMEIKNKAQMQMALQEAEMLKDIMENISHPHIMHIDKVFQVGSKFYLVFPLCTGGELYEHIIRRGHFTEYDAAVLTRNLIGGIFALHEEDILHLDIKPENILFDSQAPDAKIMITDFGLSRMLEVSSAQAPMPTMRELELKIVQFFENGILNRERLRGTVGYMSPELILCGHCSKATDIFAAGVVLYILLCGRPPFQSKSNREVLERTCRGQYTLEGTQWGDVSDSAKDLIRRMLITDPAKRITAAEILQHPWLQNLDAEVTTDTPAAGAETADLKSDSAVKSPPIPISRPRGATLQSLRTLSNHVQTRRSEKLASSFTRLVSSLQSGAWRGTSLLFQQIQLADGSPLPAIACRDEDMMVLQNPDIRQALTSVIDRVCTDGKMPVEHFICVLRHFGMGPGPISGPVSNLPGMFLCRFIDRDCDGFISADDLFTTQALIMQKNELFLRAVFRMYTEAIWYPGRQLNLASYHRSPRKSQSKPLSGRTAVLDSDDSMNSDVVEPPKFITARHVGEVFSKIGYKPDGGKHIFTVLCCVLKKRRDTLEANKIRVQMPESLTTGKVSASVLGAEGVPKPIRESQILEDSFDGASPALFDADATNLAEFSKSFADATGLESPSPAKVAPLPTLSTPSIESEDVTNGLSLKMPRSINSMSSNESTTDLERLALPDDPDINDAAIKMANSGNAVKMDVNDFMEACLMDDVLIQAVLRKPRQKFLELIDKLHVGTVGSPEPGSYVSAASPPTSELDAAMGRGVDTSALEQELIAALNLAESEVNGSFPLASAVKRVGVNAVFDLAASVTGGVTSFIRGINRDD